MPRLTQWRVRVRRSVEAWVDVDARSAAHAEEEATYVPGVISVFAKSAALANDATMPPRPEGVNDE